jgi:hypothetical protein
MAKKIGKMWFKDSIYNEIIEETKELLIKLNQNNLVNWKPKKINS